MAHGGTSLRMRVLTTTPNALLFTSQQAQGGTSLRQADVDASTLDASTAIGFLVMASDDL